MLACMYMYNYFLYELMVKTSFLCVWQGAAAGAGASDKVSNAEVLKLKREIKDQQDEIKRLQKEIRLGGGSVSAKDEISEVSQLYQITFVTIKNEIVSFFMHPICSN